MNANLFINYRREDTAPYAGRLYDRLTAHFSQDQVFIDIDQIEPGEDFVEAINRKVGTCDIAIVTIGPNWLNATDASGKRRLDDEEDFVRMEIVAALQRKVRVIPVLVGGAQMPRKQDLPEALAPLSRRNAIELSETRFHTDVNRLIEAIEKSVAVAGKSVELPPTPAVPAPEPAAVTPMEPESKDLAETFEFTKPAEPKEPMTLVKPTQTTQFPPAIPAVASISAIAALKESAVWTRKGLIIVSAVGATVIVLLAITWSLTRPHPSLTTPHPSLEPSAENDYAVAIQLANGVGGMRIDLPKAAEYLQRAAAKNVPEAEALLAQWVNNGFGGLAKDNVKGEQWAKKALADGLTAKATNSADAQSALAALYERGLGVSKDLGKAVELYQKAADQGKAGAQNRLGWLYKNGQGVPKDLGKAAELFQKAADQGHAKAQYNLGWLYENGWGVPEDLGKAAELYQKAANQGDQDAIANLKRLSTPSK